VHLLAILTHLTQSDAFYIKLYLLKYKLKSDLFLNGGYTGHYRTHCITLHCSYLFIITEIQLPSVQYRNIIT